MHSPNVGAEWSSERTTVSPFFSLFITAGTRHSCDTGGRSPGKAALAILATNRIALTSRTEEPNVICTLLRIHELRSRTMIDKRHCFWFWVLGIATFRRRALNRIPFTGLMASQETAIS